MTNTNKIVAASFDMAEQEVVLYTAEEWKEKIAEARDLLMDEFEPGWNCTDPGEEVDCMDLASVFECAFGDEFFYTTESPLVTHFRVGFSLVYERWFYLKNQRELDAWNESGANDDQHFLSK